MGTKIIILYYNIIIFVPMRVLYYILIIRHNMRAVAILIFDKCLSPRQTMANSCKTAFSLHVVESASDEYNF